MSQKDEPKQGEGGGDVAVAAPKVKPAQKASGPQKSPARPQLKPGLLPPYVVIVENDDDHSYEYVILGLCKVCGHTTEKAFELAKTIDKAGQAPVWTGSLEVAELKRDQIIGLGPDFFAESPVTYPLGVRIEALPQ